MRVTLLIDFFFKYNGIILIEKSRDLIVFITFLNLLRMTQLFQKAINSMTQFVRVIIEIL